MVDHRRRSIERRNVAQVEAWAREWSIPGGSVARGMDDLYADAPEAINVLAGIEVSAAGGEGKQAWGEAEVGVSGHYARRSIDLDGIYPSGDTVAVEAHLEAETHAGEQRGWPFASFLTFDGTGGIVAEHVYREIPEPGTPWVAREVGTKKDSPRPDASEGAMPVVAELPLTGTEQRNLSGLEAYCAAWSLPGGSVLQGVDEVYGDRPRVMLALQGVTASPASDSKEAWRRSEAEVESRYPCRAVLMAAVHPSDGTIAAEGRMALEDHEGRRTGWPFAVFLTFEDGRIVVDHTYMLRNENTVVHEEAGHGAR